MRKKLIIIALTLAMVLLILPGCSDTAMSTGGSLKTITKPYLGTYECVEARLGEKEFLEKYEYIRIELLNGNKMEVRYKPKNGQKKNYMGVYEYNEETNEFKGEIGIFGKRFQEFAKIKGGKFTLTTSVMSSPLIMKFSKI